MSYQVKKTIVSIATGVLLLAAYCIYAFGMALPPVTDEMKFWATTILIFLGIGIGATIVIQIVFHIILSIAIAVKKQIRTGKCDDKEVEKTINREMAEDEMHKLIGLKSMRVSFSIAGIGFVAALVSLVCGASAAVMLNILFLSFGAGAITEGIAQLIYYRRGVRNA